MTVKVTRSVEVEAVSEMVDAAAEDVVFGVVRVWKVVGKDPIAVKVRELVVEVDVDVVEVEVDVERVEDEAEVDEVADIEEVDEVEEVELVVAVELLVVETVAKTRGADTDRTVPVVEVVEELLLAAALETEPRVFADSVTVTVMIDGPDEVAAAELDVEIVEVAANVVEVYVDNVVLAAAEDVELVAKPVVVFDTANGADAVAAVAVAVADTRALGCGIFVAPLIIGGPGIV